jgi:hypothetical protein
MGRYQKMAVTAQGAMLSWQWRGHPEDCSAGQLGRPGPLLGEPSRLGGMLAGLHVRLLPSPAPCCTRCEVLIADGVGDARWWEQVTAVACGLDHTVAVAAGRVFSWGQGESGQLGLGDQVSPSSPTSCRLRPTLLRTDSCNCPSTRLLP